MFYKAAARAPGSCGELVQGTREGVPFLITCPVDLWTRVEVCLSGKGKINSAPRYPKIEKALAGAWRYFGKQGALSFSRDSDLPVGKGMSSSTADVSAAWLAASRCLGEELSPEEILEIALSIEPSDGLMFPGIHLLDHRQGTIVEPLGEPPPLEVLVIDPGGSVDTLDFNNRRELLSLYRSKEEETARSFQLVREGIREGDPEKIGRGATISARANQKVLPKKELEEVIKISRELKGLGVNVAHSGTVLGILLPPGGERTEEAASWLAFRKPDWRLCPTILISGGVQ